MSDEGDRKFEKFWVYYPRVFKFFSSLGYPRDKARDLTQEVYLRVYQHMDSYRDEGALSYLLTTARNIAKNDIRDRRAQKRNAVMESEETLVEMRDDRIQPMDAVVQIHQASDWLHRAVDRLDANYRACVRLYLSDLSYEEIARSLGLSESTVKSRLNIARELLREMLREELEGFGDEP